MSIKESHYAEIVRKNTNLIWGTKRSRRMGIKHLVKVENFLKKNNKSSYTETELRDTFSVNRDLIREVLSYLLDSRQVKKVKTRLRDGKKKLYKGSRPAVWYKWR